MILSTYYHCRCPSCSGTFFVDGGNPQDDTIPDIDAVTCPWCQYSMYLGDEDEECEGHPEKGVKELKGNSPELKAMRRFNAFIVANKHFGRKPNAVCNYQERGRFSFVSLPAGTKKEIESTGIYIDQWGNIIPKAKAQKIIKKQCICPKGKESTHCPVHGTCLCCHGAECPYHDEPEKIIEKK